jgi:ESS family glutamate:Na+ symporter
VNIDADVGLRDLLMVAFMTTIGLSARLQLIREGGAQVIWFLAIASLGAVLQNLLGIALAHGLGVDARLGILTGSVSLAGGPATALAFGGTFEKMGVPGATTVAFAAATFGITVAGLSGGYIGGWLVRRHRLQAEGGVARRADAQVKAGSLLNTAIVLGVAMGAGSVVRREPLAFRIGARAWSCLLMVTISVSSSGGVPSLPVPNCLPLLLLLPGDSGK